MARGDSFNERGLDRAMEMKREKQLLAVAYEKAMEDAAEDRIDPARFVNFDPFQIQDDLQYVKEKEQLFKRLSTHESENNRQLAEIFEAVVLHNIALSDWFGQYAKPRRASRYDDIKNGVDAIVQFDAPTHTSHLALALDITYDANPTEKLQKIKDQINRGKLSEIKYYMSPEDAVQTIVGSLYDIPRVVIGAEPDTVKKLAALWVGKKTQQQLENHPIQLQLLDEMSLQLQAFRDYAESVNQAGIATIFERSLRLIEEVKEEKINLSRQVGKTDYTYQDRVFRKIMDGVDYLFKPKK